jgi:hypothetical protein
MDMRRAIMVVLGVTSLLQPVAAQSPSDTAAVPRRSAGITAGFQGTTSENFGSTTAGSYGGWVDLGRGKWVTNIDASHSPEAWVLGVAALRRIEMTDRPEVFHYLIGGGVIQRDVLGAGPTLALITGIGMDIPVRRFIGRLQYRFSCGGVEGPSVSQIQLGVGWRY